MIFLSWLICSSTIKNCVLDLSKDINTERNGKDVAIPLLMRNRLPARIGEDGDEKLDVSLMPDQVDHSLYILFSS